MTLIEISPNSDAKIIQYVSNAIGLFDTGTANISGFRIHEFNLILYGLSNIVKRIGPYTFEPQKQDIIWKAISKIAQGGQSITREIIEKALEDVYNLDINIQTHDYYCITYLNISRKSFRKRIIKIGPNAIYIKGYNYIKKFFGEPNPTSTEFDIEKTHRYLDEYSFKEEFDKNCPVDSTFLITKISGTTPFSAGNAFVRLINEYLAILNYKYQIGRIGYHFGKPPEPVNFVSAPNAFFIFSDSMQPLEHMKNSETDDEPCINLQNIDRPNFVRDVDKLIRQLNQKEPELRSHLLSCLQTYNDSLENYDIPFISSFKLWQVMELLSLKEYESRNRGNITGFRSVSLTGVCNRMLLLLKIQPPCLEEDILLHFKDRRNLGVHENYTLSHSETDFNMVKDIVDGALDGIIFGEIQTMGELVSFYRR